jgi:tetratricopeptide (TPR) repeat protein
MGRPMDLRHQSTKKNKQKKKKYSKTRSVSAQRRKLSCGLLSMKTGGDTTTGNSSLLSEQLRLQGNEFYRRGELDKAKEAYTRGILLDPNNPLLWSNRSAVHLAMKNYFFSLWDAQQLYSLRPLWDKSNFRLGMANLHLEGLEAAQRAHECFRRGLLLTPTSEEMKAGLSEALRLLAEREDVTPSPSGLRMETRNLHLKEGSTAAETEKYFADNFGGPHGVWFLVSPPVRELSLSENAQARAFFRGLCKGRPVRVKDVEGMGRGLFAMKRFRARAEIFEEAPFVAVNLCQGGCERCFRPLSSSTTVVVCEGGCGKSFCSPECRQRMSSHRVLCPRSDAIAGLASLVVKNARSPSGKLHLLVAQLMAIAMEKEVYHSPFAFEELAHLSAAFAHPRHVNQALDLLEVLQDTLDLHRRSWFDAEWYVHAMSVLQNNSFTFATRLEDPYPHLSGGGSGVFPLASMLNHRCTPNAEWYFDVSKYGNTIHVRALENIQPGEQIFISYSGAAAESDDPEFRKNIFAAYSFECSCSRCARDRLQKENQK